MALRKFEMTVTFVVDVEDADVGQAMGWAETLLTDAPVGHFSVGDAQEVELTDQDRAEHIG